MENCTKKPDLSLVDQDFLRTLTQNLNLIDRRAGERFDGEKLEILSLITSSYFQIVRAMLLEPEAPDAYSIADFSDNAAITLMVSSEKARKDATSALIDRQMKNAAALIEESSKLNVMPADQSEESKTLDSMDAAIEEYRLDQKKTFREKVAEKFKSLIGA